MSDTIQDIGRDLREKIEALRGGLSDEQKTEVAELITRELESAKEAIGEEAVKRVMSTKGYTPEGGKRDPLEGTVYGRLGMTPGDVEMVHDFLEAARVADPRLPGPNEQTRNIVAELRQARAMDTAESGFGAQLVADAEYVPQIWDAAREEYGVVMGLVESRTMTGPVEKHPILGNIPDMILVSESSGAYDGSALYGTQKVASQEITLTAKKYIAHYNYSGEMVEDSVVPFVPLMRDAMALTLARTMDNLIINGDTTNAATGNINLDDADPADTLYYLGADGVRHAFIVDNTDNQTDASGTLTWAQLTGLPGKMIDRTRDQHWGRSDQIVYITHPEAVPTIQQLDEFATVDKAGDFATTRGAVAMINGVPLISTITVPLTEADGKASTTGSNNTKGTVICLNPRGLLLGFRRQAQVEVERKAGTDQWLMVLSTRAALGRYTPTGAASGIEWAAGVFNFGSY